MNFLRSAFIVLLVLLTVITAKIKPSIHQPMLIEDQDFVLTRISDTIPTQILTVAPTVNQEKEIIVQPEQVTQQTAEQFNDYQEQPITRYVDTSSPKTTQKNVNVTTPTNQTTQNNIVANLPKDEKSQLELLDKLLNTPIEQIEVNIQEQPVKTDSGKVENKPVINVQVNEQPKPKPQEVKVETPQPKSSSNPYMTEEEEIIAWNKWRANVTNQLMKDSYVGSAFIGTTFHFTFVVDKFGNVSNIRVEANPNVYMDLARDGLKPAIANLQRKPILNFPQGTKRTTVIVDDSFQISTSNIYATPNLYSDYERVKR